MIVSFLQERTVIGGIDRNTEEATDFPVVITPRQLSVISVNPDVIIDFSHPSALNELLDYCITNQAALVLATTGYNQEQIVKIHNASKKIPLFFTYNMSIGVNLIAELAKKAASVLSGQFDIEIIEKHIIKRLMHHQVQLLCLLML
ncbi:dihydrodipicolinate reductase C-terminal domain-containing protein [Peribacillus frigoritolerans]|uniref:dihydrodipicolinate reductase C-terminal domain-containing protein n=1 Tax=Peribacillus frigoritolerans TaxID=450367 RepID=UPI002024623C|nr:dihydrodipicolinate reductase C-terminal domain-containing protein [Peribacillus frigoritolerans]